MTIRISISISITISISNLINNHTNTRSLRSVQLTEGPPSEVVATARPADACAVVRIAVPGRYAPPAPPRDRDVALVGGHLHPAFAYHDVADLEIGGRAAFLQVVHDVPPSSGHLAGHHHPHHDEPEQLVAVVL